MNLYDIPTELDDLLNAYSVALTNDEREQIADKIQSLEIERDEKIISILKKIRSAIHTQQAISIEIKLLQQMKIANENQVNRLRSFLVDLFPGYKPDQCPVPFHWQQRWKVSIQDERQVPDWCYETLDSKPPEPKLSLKIIEEQYKEGNEVPGTSYNQEWVPAFPKKPKENKDEQRITND